MKIIAMIAILNSVITGKPPSGEHFEVLQRSTVQGYHLKPKPQNP